MHNMKFFIETNEVVSRSQNAFFHAFDTNCHILKVIEIHNTKFSEKYKEKIWKRENEN